ncbi:site-specific recombinase XerD [Algoriphagus ratkowskyi]|uniref:Site-specific integrase n=1 Tax=Algoriphagus ratkowskyi TaxID=57028 RepID=A0A2W7QV99_9BACT|nr:site-specific integrase [Algoriphagus ratkowskyi]PZX52453.1 site-specific recombinase XerD [Algoriphagus ratkowskyi]TXD76200.1 site-specific integrase [Algoriphagus ratkowskyi]
MTRKTDKAKDPVTVSHYLDTRRKKDNGLFPVKIRVYDATTKKARLYTTDFDLTEKNFKRIIFPEEGQRFNKAEKEIREDLESLKAYYSEKITDLKSFTFENLEKSLEIKSGDLMDSFFHFEAYIKELREAERIGTASSYGLSMKSLKAYIKDKTGKEPKSLLLQDITVKFLNDYETWMTVKESKSLTTVGIYLRGLRVIFNRAIETKAIDKDLYPFGVKKYEIPASTNPKKAFDSNQLTTLFQVEAQTPEQKKARDFWFFSFVCNGMNMKDILHLKWKNIDGEQIIFVREKTKRTKKANSKPIQVPLTDFAKSFIVDYGTTEQSPNGFVFPILNEKMTAEKQHFEKLKFIRFVNQHIKHLAKANGLTGDISTYWARHSFATSAVRKKASLEYVSEALGHSDLKTTKNYFAGFEDKTKKEILEDITDFMRK